MRLIQFFAKKRWNIIDVLSCLIFAITLMMGFGWCSLIPLFAASAISVLIEGYAHVHSSDEIDEAALEGDLTRYVHDLNKGRE